MPHSTSVPGRATNRSASWLAIVPDGTYSAASFPSSAAASDSRRRTVGSSPYASSPTSASAIARRISGVGVVTVSERRSTAPDGEGMPLPLGRCRALLHRPHEPFLRDGDALDAVAAEDRPQRQTATAR